MQVDAGTLWSTLCSWADPMRLHCNCMSHLQHTVFMLVCYALCCLVLLMNLQGHLHRHHQAKLTGKRHGHQILEYWGWWQKMHSIVQIAQWEVSCSDQYTMGLRIDAVQHLKMTSKCSLAASAHSLPKSWLFLLRLVPGHRILPSWSLSCTFWG